MKNSDDAVVIEEIDIEKPSSTGWFVLGAIVVAIAVLFGMREVRRRRTADGDAPPETPAT